MRILSLYVENFGTLQGFSFQPANGLNTLLRPNGWGKSSLAVFIKAMLYGLPVSTRRSLIENERKRYTPWQGGVYGGSMDVEVGGRQLRIERTFGAKESEDTMTLTDLQTGMSDPVEGRLSCGEEWFGVDAAAYERSTYLSQRPIDESDGNLSIHAKLNRLVDATDDIGSYDLAVDLLEKQRKYYTVSGGRRGAIADDDELLSQLERQMAECRVHSQAAAQCNETLAALADRLAQTRRESEMLLAREQAYLKAGELEAKRQTCRKLLALADEAGAAYEQIMASLGGALPTPQMISQLEKLESERAAAQLQAQQLAQCLESRSPARQEMVGYETLFGENVPDDAALIRLRQVAEQAKSAEQRWQDALERRREREPSDREATEQMPPLPDARRLQHFCLQYDGQARSLVRERDRTAAAMHQAEIRVEQSRKGKRRAALLSAVLALCATAATAMCAIFLPRSLGAVLPVCLLILVCSIGAWVLLARIEKNTTEEYTRAHKSCAEAHQAYKEHKKQLEIACHRVKDVLGVSVTDAVEAAEAIAEYERACAQAQMQKQERAAAEKQWLQRKHELRTEAEAQRSRFAEIWGWGALPAVKDTPVEVERLAQKVARYQELERELADAHKRQQALHERIFAIESERRALLGGCDSAPESGAAAWLRERSESAVRSREEQARHRAEAQAYALQQGLDIAALPAGSPDVMEEQEDFHEQRERLHTAEEQLHGEIARTQRELDEHQNAAAVIDALESEAALVRTRLERARAALSTVQTTQKYLKTAREQLSGRYLQRMKDSFADYLGVLTGENDAVFTMDGNFTVKLRRVGVARPTDAMSAGWRDVISLCARLSLVDALFEGETPFLVLDDPFANFDDDTAARAAQLLHRAAEKYQILYLTCHSSRT